MAMLRFIYELRALFLDFFGCEVFEDLSAICSWGTYSVPW
jgi:hypothetical protein